LRVREFTLAEIEHFVDPENKAHLKFSKVANLEFLMFPREEQMFGHSAKRIPLGEAISRVGLKNICFYCLCWVFCFSFICLLDL
jgi:glycyl-tRNA synthetase